jgi:hypothetical protein
VTVNLHAELWRAMQFARHSLVAAQLLEMDLSPRVQWGIGRVEFIDGGGYVPRVDGPAMALIVPVVEFGDTIDLCAIEMPSQRLAVRLGLGGALGLDVIQRARWDERSLSLTDRPLRWLRAPVDCACILDWRLATHLLDGIGKVVCDSLALVDQVEAAFAHPIQPPLIGVRA